MAADAGLGGARRAGYRAGQRDVGHKAGTGRLMH